MNLKQIKSMTQLTTFSDYVRQHSVDFGFIISQSQESFEKESKERKSVALPEPDEHTGML